MNHVSIHTVVKPTGSAEGPKTIRTTDLEGCGGYYDMKGSVLETEGIHLDGEEPPTELPFVYVVYCAI